MNVVLMPKVDIFVVYPFFLEGESRRGKTSEGDREYTAHHEHCDCRK